MRAEIFVLNYNGADLLLECLPSIIEGACVEPSNPYPVTVIDNQSQDNSLQVLKANFPQVNVYISPKNTVLCAFNDAVKKSEADIVILLNNDLKVDRHFIPPLIQVFQDHSDAFLAAPLALTFDRKQYEGSLSKMYFRYGIFGSLSRFKGYEDKIHQFNFTMQAGFGAYKRSVFLQLGGFDDLYLPGTMEDSDLCYRAWRAGYKSYYQPASQMLHKGQATFKRNFSRMRLRAINQRNLYLFTWKNITDKRLLLSHLLWLLPRLIYFLLKGRFEFLLGLVWALPRLPQAISRRIADQYKKSVLSDQEIFLVSNRI